MAEENHDWSDIMPMSKNKQCVCEMDNNVDGATKSFLCMLFIGINMCTKYSETSMSSSKDRWPSV